MSILSDKSDVSDKASTKLYSQSYFCSSVHCSYYSCVQLMLHILRSHLNKTDREVDREYKNAKTGLHAWLIGVIFREIIKKNFNDARDFKNTIGVLKQKRVDADYKNIKIEQSDAKMSCDYSVEILKILNNNFTI